MFSLATDIISGSYGKGIYMNTGGITQMYIAQRHRNFSTNKFKISGVNFL